MKEDLKKYKWIFIAALVLMIITIALFAFSKKQNSESVKIIPVTPTTPAKTAFKLLNTDPPSGPRSTSDGGAYVSFTFTKPVDYKSVVIQVNPPIKLRVVAFDNKKNVLVMMPNYDTWKPEVTYKIILNNINSIDGDSLGNSIEYTYLSHALTNVNWGGD
ncbi:MAG TPA: hypothetical protein VLI92_02955 [Candidatus Saccharimonadales bacterium]|nr:hypothetical protein [Candidatus Saccharimonadales bacterium]